MLRLGARGWRDLRLVGLGAVAGVLLVVAIVGMRAPAGPGPSAPGEPEPGWREIAWPLPVDPWWPSKAYTCAGKTCGAEVTLYVRAKIGFCNCKTGVADDEELERIGDFAVLAGRHEPIAAGKPIEIAWMKGRSRPYDLDAKHAGARAGRALLIGYNDRCDAIVATALVGNAEPLAVEAAVLSFLRSPSIMRWAELTLGL